MTDREDLDAAQTRQDVSKKRAEDAIDEMNRLGDLREGDADRRDADDDRRMVDDQRREADDQRRIDDDKRRHNEQPPTP